MVVEFPKRTLTSWKRVPLRRESASFIRRHRLRPPAAAANANTKLTPRPYGASQRAATTTSDEQVQVEFKRIRHAPGFIADRF